MLNMNQMVDHVKNILDCYTDVTNGKWVDIQYRKRITWAYLGRQLGKGPIHPHHLCYTCCPFNLGRMYHMYNMTNISCSQTLCSPDLTACQTPATDAEWQIWMVFSYEASLVSVMVSQTYAFKSQSLSPSASNTLRQPPRTAVRTLSCCVGWNHSYLTEENVFACPWRRAVRDGGRRAQSSVDVGVAGGIEYGKGAGLGWAGLRGLQAFVFLSHPWQGGERWADTGAKHSGALAGLWQRFRNQRRNATRSYYQAALLGLCGHADGDAGINKVMLCKKRE